MQSKWIWYQWFKEASNMPCTICNQNNMIANESGRTWINGLIIGRRERGVETYPNVMPVCITCGQILQMENGGVIDYMVYIGKMSEQEGNNTKQRIYEEMIRYDSICPIKKRNGEKCTRLKCSKDIHMCEIHYMDSANYATPMDIDYIGPSKGNSYYF